MNKFFKIKLVKNPKGYSTWNKTWQNTYKKGRELFCAKSVVEGNYLIWSGSHHFGTLTLTEEEMKDCARSVRVNGKVQYVSNEIQKRLEKDYNWLITS